MRGAGIYGGRAPEPVADPGELSREMDRIQAEREAEDARAYEPEDGEYEAEDAEDEAHREPATLAEAWAAFEREGSTADAVRSYLASGAQPRYDTPEARTEAQAEWEAGS